VKINEYYTRSQAAEYLGITKNTLIGWEDKGLIVPFKDPMSGFHLYKEEDLQAILDNIKKAE